MNVGQCVVTNFGTGFSVGWVCGSPAVVLDSGELVFVDECSFCWEID